MNWQRVCLNSKGVNTPPETRLSGSDSSANHLLVTRTLWQCRSSPLLAHSAAVGSASPRSLLKKKKTPPQKKALCCDPRSLRGAAARVSNRSVLTPVPEEQWVSPGSAGEAIAPQFLRQGCAHSGRGRPSPCHTPPRPGAAGHCGSQPSTHPGRGSRAASSSRTGRGESVPDQRGTNPD